MLYEVITKDVDKWCKYYQYDNCELVHAIIKSESGYNPTSFVDEKSGSYGLMMVQCDTAKDPRLEAPLKYGCDQLFNPQLNVRYGIMYLKMIQKLLIIADSEEEFIKDLIAVYNAGFDKTKISKEITVAGDIIVATGYKPRKCKHYNKFRYDGFPPQECYPGEYINEEHVWKVYRRYKFLKEKSNEMVKK